MATCIGGFPHAGAVASIGGFLSDPYEGGSGVDASGTFWYIDTTPGLYTRALPAPDSGSPDPWGYGYVNTSEDLWVQEGTFPNLATLKTLQTTNDDIRFEMDVRFNGALPTQSGSIWSSTASQALMYPFVRTVSESEGSKTYDLHVIYVGTDAVNGFMSPHPNRGQAVLALVNPLDPGPGLAFPPLLAEDWVKILDYASSNNTAGSPYCEVDAAPLLPDKWYRFSTGMRIEDYGADYLVFESRTYDENDTLLVQGGSTAVGEVTVLGEFQNNPTIMSNCIASLGRPRFGQPPVGAPACELEEAPPEYVTDFARVEAPTACSTVTGSANSAFTGSKVHTAVARIPVHQRADTTLVTLESVCDRPMVITGVEWEAFIFNNQRRI